MSRTHNYRGFTIARGDYQTTADNRLDGWYVDSVDADLCDRRGSGFATLAVAKAAIDDHHAAMSHAFGE